MAAPAPLLVLYYLRHLFGLRMLKFGQLPRRSLRDIVVLLCTSAASSTAATSMRLAGDYLTSPVTGSIAGCAARPPWGLFCGRVVDCGGAVPKAALLHLDIDPCAQFHT